MKARFLSILFFALAPVVVFGVEAGDAQPELHKVVDRIAAAPSYNLITDAAPRAITLGELGLHEIGLHADTVWLRAAELRIFANRDSMNDTPKMRFWLNSRDGHWRLIPDGKEAADAVVIQPGEVVLLINRGVEKEIEWKNPLAE